MKKILLHTVTCIFSIGYIFAQGIYGIDVSHYQGSINWQQVSNSGKVFALVKCTEGYTGPDDTYYYTNITGATSAGITVGAYHFAHPENNTAAHEATHFLGAVGNYAGTGYLPPVLDMEPDQIDDYIAQGHSYSALAQWINSWATQVHNAKGVWPLLYITTYYAGQLFPYHQNGTINSNIKLWIADYPATAGNPSYPNMASWTWQFHQYSETGSVSGINGAVDLDYFNGSLADFNNLIGSSSSSAPSNDDCPGSLIISNGQCLIGDVAGATGSYGANNCSGSGMTSPDDNDVYFYFEASSSSETITISNYANNFDAVIELRTACGYNTAISCYDPTGAPSSVSHTWTGLTPGQYYYVRVYEYNSSGTPPNSTTFTICLTHVNSCTPPNNIYFSGNQSVCSGSTANISVSASNCGNGCTYSWSNNMGSGSSKNLSSGYYTVTVTNSSGCSATSSVTINSSPSVSAPTFSPSPATGCGSVEVTANSSGCSSCNYQWNNGGGNPNTITQSGNYTVTATNNSNCSASASVYVTVNAQPNVTISASNTNITSGQQVTLTASGASSYSWSTGSSNSQITVSPSSTTTYSVTGTSNSCTATASVTINVTTASCSSSTATLSSTSQSFTNVATQGGFNVTFNPSTSGCTWSVSQNDCSFITNLTPSSGQSSSGQVSFNVSANTGPSRNCTLKVSAGSNTYDYTITQSGTSGPCNPPLSAPQVTLNGCNFVAQNIQGVSYQWYLNGSIIPNATNRFYTATSTGYYFVVITDGGNCTAQSSDTYADCPTAISDLTEETLSIIPNPSNGSFTVSFEVEKPENIQLKVFNSLGQIVVAQKPMLVSGAYSQQLNLTQMPKGIYLLQLKVGEQLINKQVIIQ